MRHNCFFSLLFTLIAATGLQAAVVYVDIDATGANDGTSWANAYTDLREAMDLAAEGDEIWVAEGVYKPTNTTDRNIRFSVARSMDLYGGFNGTETARNQRNWDANQTIMSGAIGSQTDVTDNTRKLLSVYNYLGETTNTIIDGFKFQRAYSDSLGSTCSVSQEGGQAEFRHCEFRTITNEVAPIFYINGSEVVFEDCLFRDCDSEFELVSPVVGGDVTVTNCTFAQCNVREVLDEYSSAIIRAYNCVFNENTWVSEELGVTELKNCLVQSSDYTAVTVENVVVGDALFVDPSTNDFRLQEGSPAVDLGSDVYNGSGRDLQLGVRVYGMSVDAGCYETRTPTRFFVDQDATGLNNGITWEHAFNDLQYALSQVSHGDVLWVKAGTYYPGTDPADSFYIAQDITLIGGFDGTETAKNQRDWINNLTILSGEIGGAGETDNSTHVLEVAPFVSNCTLDGFVVSGGYADGSSSENYGGGLYADTFATINVYNTWFSNNEATSRGGALYTNQSTVHMTGCVFTENESRDGAALYFNQSESNLENCFFRSNTGIDQGIVYFTSDTGQPLTMAGCTFTENTLFAGEDDDDIGIITCIADSSDLTLANSIIWNNTLGTADAMFGFNEMDDLVTHCIIEGGWWGDNVSDQDPQFVNPALLDFSPSLASPALNAGDESFVTTDTDALAQPRVALGHVDIGAIESSGAVPGVIYVDQDATGNNDGTSWANAFVTLHEALADGPSGEDIWVAEGTYYPTSGTDREDHPVISTELYLYGGFDGTETERTQRDIRANETILSGNIGSTGASGDNSERLLTFSNCPEGELDGFTLKEADSGLIFGANYWGALGFVNSNVSLKNVVFTDNQAYSGAAINAEDSQLEIENALIFENATQVGGIISTTDGPSDITLTHVTITDNEVGGSSPVIKGLTGANIIVRNTIIWEDPIHPFGNTFSNNEAYNTILSTTLLTLDAYSNVRSEDPLFVDPTNDDYTITAASNAYDSGDSSYTSSTADLNGNSRTVDTEVDRGCYESLVCEQPNDDIENAIALVLNGSPRFASNRCATVDAGLPIDCFINNGHSIWFTFVPTSEWTQIETAFVSKFTGTFNMRTVVYSGTPGNLTVEACDNQAGPETGETTLVGPLNIGETYYIRTDGFGTQEGRFTIRAFAALPPAVPGVVYVDTDALGANDGSSWGNAFTDLQSALAAVADGEEIWVAEGTYVPGSTFSDTFEIDHSIGLFGGFAGNETSKSERDVDAHVTILSGEIGTPDLSDNISRVLSIELENLNIELDGFTVERGNNAGLVPFATSGAGIYIYANNTVVARNLVIRDNHGTIGAGIYSLAELSLFACVFADNTTTGDGAGIFSSIGDNHTESCLFTDHVGNTVIAFSGASGNANNSVVNCTFTGNDTSQFPSSGVVSNYFTNNPSRLVNCIFWDNEVGGVVEVSVDPDDFELITRCISQDNSTDEPGLTVADPQFTDPASSDYSLMETSPAVGFGQDGIVLFTSDAAGNVRTQGAAIDAGAFESSFERVGCTASNGCNYDPIAVVDAGCTFGICAPCYGDYDGNESIGSGDLLEVIANYNTNVGFAFNVGDLDGDGYVDTNDVLTIIGLYGSSCP